MDQPAPTSASPPATSALTPPAVPQPALPKKPIDAAVHLEWKHVKWFAGVLLGVITLAITVIGFILNSYYELKAEVKLTDSKIRDAMTPLKEQQTKELEALKKDLDSYRLSIDLKEALYKLQCSGTPDDMIAEYQEFRRAHPDLKIPRQVMGTVANYLVSAYKGRGKYSLLQRQQVVELDEFVDRPKQFSLCSGSSNGLHDLALCYLAVGDPLKAKHLLLATLEIYSNEPSSIVPPELSLYLIAEFTLNQQGGLLAQGSVEDVLKKVFQRQTPQRPINATDLLTQLYGHKKLLQHLQTYGGARYAPEFNRLGTELTKYKPQNFTRMVRRGNRNEDETYVVWALSKTAGNPSIDLFSPFQDYPPPQDVPFTPPGPPPPQAPPVKMG